MNRRTLLATVGLVLACACTAPGMPNNVSPRPQENGDSVETDALGTAKPTSTPSASTQSQPTSPAYGTPFPTPWAGAIPPNAWPPSAEPMLLYPEISGGYYIASADGTYRWLVPHTSDCTSVGWSADGQLLRCDAVTGERFFDLAGNTVLTTSERDLLFNRQRSHLLGMASATGTPPAGIAGVPPIHVFYKLYRADGALVAQLTGVSDRGLRSDGFNAPYGGSFGVHAARWSADGQRLAYRSGEQQISIYDVASGRSTALDTQATHVVDWILGDSALLLARNVEPSEFHEYFDTVRSELRTAVATPLPVPRGVRFAVSPNGRQVLYEAGKQAVGYGAVLAAIDLGTLRVRTLQGQGPCAQKDGGPLPAMFSPDGSLLFWLDACHLPGDPRYYLTTLPDGDPQEVLLPAPCGEPVYPRWAASTRRTSPDQTWCLEAASQAGPRPTAILYYTEVWTRRASGGPSVPIGIQGQRDRAQWRPNP